MECVKLIPGFVLFKRIGDDVEMQIVYICSSAEFSSECFIRREHKR